MMATPSASGGMLGSNSRAIAANSSSLRAADIRYTTGPIRSVVRIKPADSAGMSVIAVMNRMAA